MNWILQRFAAALITGVGIKLGGDVYETLKAKLKERNGKTNKDDDVSDATVAAVDAAQDPVDGLGADAEAAMSVDAVISVEEALR
jgi:hypothetical protein